VKLIKEKILLNKIVGLRSEHTFILEKIAKDNSVNIYDYIMKKTNLILIFDKYLDKMRDCAGTGLIREIKYCCYRNI
jgi:hypothetical protein